MLSPDAYHRDKSSFELLLGKEWRNLASGRAFWLLLLLLCLLVGYSYIQAVVLYGEASRSAGQLPEVARNLSPLDGMLVPTFGALYLANTFLFPFVIIRTIGHEKETGNLKLLLQLPCPLSVVLAAKVAALAGVWLLMALPSVAAVILWIAAGGHVELTEFANLLFGHFLYGAVVVGFALVAAALADSSATAAIIALAVTLGFWVLDFAAAGDSGLVKSLSSLSLTNFLRTFERGIFSLGSVLGAFAASAGLIIVTGFLINAKVTGARKLLLCLLTLLAAGGLVAGASQLRIYADASQDQRNSFAPADVSTLSELRQRLTIVVRLAPEDPRYVDFEHNVLDKLQRILPDVKVVLESQSRTGAFEESSEQYGTVLYRYGGKQAASRSTGTGEILPLLYGLAGVERKVVAPAPVYPGYPLEASPRAAEIFFYGVLPMLIMITWVAAQGLIGRGRAQNGVRSRNTFAVGGQGDGKGDAT